MVPLGCLGIKRDAASAGGRRLPRNCRVHPNSPAPRTGQVTNLV